MAITNVSKKVLVSKVKKTIKNVIKKIFPTINNKKNMKKVVCEEVNHDSEINDNIQNELLEARLLKARLREMIEASPATLLPETSAIVSDSAFHYDEDSNTIFTSFWINEDDQIPPPNYSKCPRYCSVPLAAEITCSA